jgi:hypothetical protein
MRCEGMEIGNYNAAAARSVLNADVYVAAPFNSTVADLTFYSSLSAPTQRAFVVRGASPVTLYSTPPAPALAASTPPAPTAQPPAAARAVVDRPPQRRAPPARRSSCSPTLPVARLPCTQVYGGSNEQNIAIGKLDYRGVAVWATYLSLQDEHNHGIQVGAAGCCAPGSRGALGLGTHRAERQSQAAGHTSTVTRVLRNLQIANTYPDGGIVLTGTFEGSLEVGGRVGVAWPNESNGAGCNCPLGHNQPRLPPEAEAALPCPICLQIANVAARVTNSPVVVATLMPDGSHDAFMVRLPPSAGCWLLAAGCWPLAAGCWPLPAGCWLLAAGWVPPCPLRAASFSVCARSTLVWLALLRS